MNGPNLNIFIFQLGTDHTYEFLIIRCYMLTIDYESGMVPTP